MTCSAEPSLSQACTLPADRRARDAPCTARNILADGSEWARKALERETGPRSRAPRHAGKPVLGTMHWQRVEGSHEILLDEADRHASTKRVRLLAPPHAHSGEARAQQRGMPEPARRLPAHPRYHAGCATLFLWRRLPPRRKSHQRSGSAAWTTQRARARVRILAFRCHLSPFHFQPPSTTKRGVSSLRSGSGIHLLARPREDGVRHKQRIRAPRAALFHILRNLDVERCFGVCVGETVARDAIQSRRI